MGDKFIVMIVAIIAFVIVSIASIIGLSTYMIHKTAVDNGYIQTTTQGSNCILWSKEK